MDLHTFQNEEKAPTITSFLKKKKGGGREIFSRIFQQAELSLLFLICICPYTII